MTVVQGHQRDLSIQNLHFPGPQCPRGRAFRWLHRALGRRRHGAFHGARHACRARRALRRALDRALGRAFDRLGFSTSHLAYGQIGQHNAASWTKFFCSQSLWDAQNCVVLQTSQVTEPSGSHPTSAPGAHRRRLGGANLRIHTLLTFFSSRVPNDGVSSKMVFDVWSTPASW